MMRRFLWSCNDARKGSPSLVALLAVCGLLFSVSNAAAYIGPGSGVEFIGYFLSLAAWVGAAFFSILLWPLYTLVRRFRGKKPGQDTHSAPVTPGEKPDQSVSSPS